MTSVALAVCWVSLGSLWIYDAYMWWLGRAVFDLVLVRYCILMGRIGHVVSTEKLQLSGPDRLRGGRGRETLPFKSLFVRLVRFGGFDGAARHLHA